MFKSSTRDVHVGCMQGRREHFVHALGPAAKEVDFADACASVLSLVCLNSHRHATKMAGPRLLPLTAFAPRFAALTHAPARLIPAPACRPRISASATFRHSRSLSRSSSPLQKLVADAYTPDLLPNAAWPYLYRPPDKMAHLDPYFKQVDALQGNFIERLREAVAIPSISSEDQRRPDVVKACFPSMFTLFRSLAD